MFLLKTKGTVKIPDYLQIRNEYFVLVIHCKLSNFEEMITEKFSAREITEISNKIASLEYGKLVKL